MAAIASFLVARETDNANRLTNPENLYIYQVSRELWEQKIKLKKENCRQVAAILIIGGKLKI